MKTSSKISYIIMKNILRKKNVKIRENSDIVSSEIINKI